MNKSVVSRIGRPVAVVVTLVAATLLAIGSVSAQVLYDENFNDRTAGQITDPQDTVTPGNPADGIGDTLDDNNNFWSWNGPDSGNVTHTWSFVSDGSGGQALEVEVDGSLAVGTDWWWGLGIGKSGIFPGIPAGVTDFSRVQFEADIQILNPNTAYTPPNNQYINVHIAGVDTVAATTMFETNYTPAFPDANPTHVSFTLDQATHAGGFPDTMNSDTQLTLRFDWNNWNNASDMGLDDDNILRLDNLKITVLDAGIPGDFDDDTDVDADDINILADMLFRGGADPGGDDSADLDGAGGPNQDDMDYMVSTLLETVYGDADLDDDVDGADFDAWRIRDSLGGGIGWATGDWDGDNDVDGADFDHWRLRLPAIGGGGVAAVPEPATLVLMGLAVPALGLIARRRR